MEYIYRYGDQSRLYLNVTNRCTNDCSFCVRGGAEGLGGANLKGDQEPDINDLQNAIDQFGGLSPSLEFVWCGFGEPTHRLELILEMSARMKRAGARVRLNTNGHANLINGRDCLPELGDLLDAVSISLNAPNKHRYIELSRPVIDSIPDPKGQMTADIFWESMIEFLTRSPQFIAKVQASVVGYTLSEQEIDESEALAKSLGATFRVR